MILYVHSSGVYDRGRTFGRHRNVQDVVHLTVLSKVSIPDMVAGIIERVQQRRSIWLMIFNAHGSPARISIGRGIDELSVYDLAPLRAYMTPGGPGVEVHACNVAARQAFQHDMRFLDEGLEMLRRMAHVLDSTVRASSHQQVGIRDGALGPVLGSDPWGRFEGDYVDVQPDGRVRHHVLGGSCADGSCALPERP